MEERITLNRRYEIIDKVGGGGMAEVFHGYDTVLHRDVGIKILRDQFIQDKDFVARFRQEACNAAGLSHPNIVNIYDFGSEHDINYIVMEYVVGRTLKEVITDSGALDYQTAVKYAIGIASALKQAHDHAIVHCDVKSQNILIDTKGIAKITDFGIARAFGQPSESEERGVIGSVYYLSPEQAAGKPVTAQSDLYSLGVVLFEMLTGQLPYDGDTPAEVARQHLTSPTPSARRYDPEIPYDLDAIVTKALAKNPLLRYKTDDDFLSDLRRVETRLRKAEMSAEGPLSPHHKGVSDETIIIHSEEMGDGLLRKTPLRDDSPDSGVAAAEKEPPKKNKTKKMLGLFIGAILLLSALIYGIVGYSSGDIAVPDVKGKTLVEAEAILKDNNLDFTLKEEFDAKVPTGTVIKQSPGAGSHVKAGRKIQLTVSKGAEPGVVPDLKSKNLAEATEMLHAAKLAVGKVTVQYKEGAAQGAVLSQDIEAGKKVAAGTKVDLVVNISKGQSVVPDLKGLTLPDARERLSSMGLMVGSVTTKEDNAPKGTVIGAEPEFGKVLSEGSVVTLIVSGGKKEEKKQKESSESPSRAAKTYTVSFTVPGSGSAKQVKIVASDATSSRVLYSGSAAPGTHLRETVTLGQDASVQFYVNGALVEDRSL
ncbi:MAG: Stk1 family PASTA domain-containing Ser/Thr kinase [Acidaminococcus intestini]|uniref:non-specific serine/threonine protein kinase n=1 Tax=Acidaminococcus intestini TaxID=187327 RepID=A0A943ELB4_9FIRM|nr:Stk1 family PASTA domain-containing Ser/Thr kinase [Acidaminococcus intestini]